jgi:hypothetical protein
MTKGIKKTFKILIFVSNYHRFWSIFRVSNGARRFPRLKMPVAEIFENSLYKCFLIWYYIYRNYDKFVVHPVR